MRQLAIIGFGLLVCATGYAVRLTDEGVMAFGKRWSSQRIGSSHLLDATYNGERFVAVGQNGVILTSDDATNWVVRGSGTTEDLHKVVWLNGQFFTLGYGGLILTSEDGEIWIKRYDQGAHMERLFGIAYNGEVYIAVGYTNRIKNNGPLILKSTDGVEWVSVNPPEKLASLADVLWVNDRFVTLAEGELELPFGWSLDGEIWEAVDNKFTSYPAQYLLWDGSKIMAVGTTLFVESIYFKQFISTDGVVWEETTGQSDQYLDYVKIHNGVYYGFGYSEKGFTGPPILPSYHTRRFTDTIYYSSDGFKWVEVYHNNNYELRAFAWSDTHFVAVGKSGRILTNQFSVGSIFPADGIADYLEGLGFYYDGFYPFVWSWDEESWFWVADDGASLEEGFYFWHFGLNNWCWSNQGFFPWYYEFDPEAGDYREFGSGEESNE